MIPYSLGAPAQSEVDYLSSVGMAPPDNWFAAEQEEYRLIQVGNLLVGFIRMPELSPPDSTPSPKIIDSALEIIAKLRQRGALVVMLSPWGKKAEQAFLEQELDDYPDLLLGSGKGTGLLNKIMADGRTVHIRAYDRGRSMHRIDIFEKPEHNKPVQWKKLDNIRVQVIPLGDNVRTDPKIDALFAN